MEIRQSDLQSYARCPQEKFLRTQADLGLVPRPKNLSATVYGTVMHHALQTLERLHAEGHADPLGVARSTFAHYWDPEHLPEMAVHHPELVHGIDEWLPRQTYGGLRSKGLESLGVYYDLLRTEIGTLLALEVEFRVPIDLTEYGVSGEHFVKGTIDKLMMRRHNRKPIISIEDFKTGKQKWGLRWNVQWTVYSWATLQPEFWLPWGDEANARWELYADWPRRGTWWNMAEIKQHDCGWRVEADYQRMKLALAEFVKANDANVFPLNITGDTCRFCDFKDGTCGGIAVPEENEGRP